MLLQDNTQAQNGTSNYTNGNTIMINIPTSPNTVLVPSESFLKFDLGGITNGAVASAYLRLDKAGAHGSQELENLDNYYSCWWNDCFNAIQW